MDNLHCLFTLSLEEGKQHLRQLSLEEEQTVAATAWLEEEALNHLYAPFTSLKLAELLMFLGEDTNNSISHALGLKAQGDALVQIGHYKAAIKSLDEAGALFLQQRDEENWARSRISWIVACAWLGDIEEALREAEQARAVFSRLDKPSWVCTIDNNIAVIYGQAGRYQEAHTLYERMRATYLTLVGQDSTSVLHNAALVDLNQSVNLAWLGDLLPPSPVPEQDDGGKGSGSPLFFGYSDQVQLRYVPEEVRRLSTMLQGKCYLEEEATIARLTQEAPGSPIIHVATHGQNRVDAPNFSSVLLADGKLNAIDVFNLNLRDCELVTLSGCETGLSMSMGGDEQLGLGRAFLAAGAEALVMSLWPVEDQTTSELMEIFYSALLGKASRVEALRTAQCDFLARADPEHAHPYYWAAFRLVGATHPLRWHSSVEATATSEFIGKKV